MTGPIPNHLKESVDRYVIHGIPTGGFLRSVLENDLTESVGRADEINMRLLPEIVSYLYNECPSTCWGTPERVREWLENAELRKEMQR